jgi:hypothetical protein
LRDIRKPDGRVIHQYTTKTNILQLQYLNQYETYSKHGGSDHDHLTSPKNVNELSADNGKHEGYGILEGVTQ